MPSIIDVFAVELGLDPTKFKKGVNDAIDDLRRLKEQSEKNTREVEENAKHTNEAFEAITKQVTKLAAAYLSFTAIKGFIRDLVEQNMALNNQAAVLGISIEKLSAMNNMAKLVGSSAQGMSQALASVQQQLVAMNTFHLPPSQSFLQGAAMLGINQSAFLGPNVSPDSFIISASTAAQRQLRAGQSQAAVSQELRKLGITDTGLLAAMMQRNPEELRQFIEEMKKAVPTQTAIDATKRFNEELGRMEATFGKMSGDMAQLLPMLTPFIRFLDGLMNLLDKFVNIMPQWVWRFIGESQFGLNPGAGVAAMMGMSPGTGGGRTGTPGGSTSSIASRVGSLPSAPGHSNSYLAQARASRINEINSDPELKENVLKMLQLEEGTIGGKTGAMEALLNRSIMTGNTIRQELFSGFYGPINRGQLRQPLSAGARASSEAAFNAAAGGSNTILGRTDQGMVGDPNAMGPGRVQVPGTTGIFNYWKGTRNGRAFTHADSERFAEEQNRKAAEADKPTPDRVSGWAAMFNMFSTPADAGQEGSNGKASKAPWYQGYWDSMKRGYDKAMGHDKHSMLHSLDHPALFQNSSVSNSSVSTAETHIGTVAFYTQSTDPRGLASEIMPMLNNRRLMMAANNVAGGPV